TLNEILAESKLHTRAFYRHFQTKDELLLAIYREDADELHRTLAHLVDDAPSPADGVLAWIDEMLRVQFDPKTARHVSFFRDPAALQVMHELGGTEISNHLRRPLQRALAAGRDDGSLPGAVPEVHADCISALIWYGVRSVPGRRRQDRWLTTREIVVSFVMGGLALRSEAVVPPPRRHEP